MDYYANLAEENIRLGQQCVYTSEGMFFAAIAQVYATLALAAATQAPVDSTMRGKK